MREVFRYPSLQQTQLERSNPQKQIADWHKHKGTILVSRNKIQSDIITQLSSHRFRQIQCIGIQRAQFTWYVTNQTIRNDLRTPTVREEMHQRSNKHYTRLKARINPPSRATCAGTTQQKTLEMLAIRLEIGLQRSLAMETPYYDRTRASFKFPKHQNSLQILLSDCSFITRVEKETFLILSSFTSCGSSLSFIFPIVFCCHLFLQLNQTTGCKLF